MARFGRVVCLLAFLGVLSAEAAPFRVLVQPAEGNTLGLKAEEAAWTCVSLHLQDRLAGVPGVEVAGERLAGALLFEVQGGRRSPRDRGLLEEVCEFVPIDAVVTGTQTNGVLTVVVRTASGDVRKEFSVRVATDVPAAVYGASAFVGETLKLDPATRALLGERRVPDAALAPCYLSVRLNASWINNSGEERLKLLRPFLKDAVKHPAVAAYFLEAGQMLSQDRRKPENAGGIVQLARLALLAALGTTEEDGAIVFARRNEHDRGAAEAELLSVVKVLMRDELDEAVMDEESADALSPSRDPVVALLSGTKTPTQLAGALRCLGAMASMNALPFLKKAAEHKDPALRAGAADALAGYPAAASAAILARLESDADPQVAFAAAVGLWKQGGTPEKAAAAARKLAVGREVPSRVVEALSAGPIDGDAARLVELSKAGRSEERGLAIRGLGTLGKVDAATLLEWLHTVDDGVLSAAVSCVRGDAGEAIGTRLVALANSPYSTAADMARSALGVLRPADDPERTRFDLRTAPLYTRLRLVDRLAAGGAGTLDVLASCVTNPNHHVRGYSIDKLAQVAPERAAELLPVAIRDPYVWPRVHAAAVAARHATSDQAGALRESLATERHVVVGLYLEEALARAEGRPAPAPRKPVNGFSTNGVAFGGCGFSDGVRTSPLIYYYCLDASMTAAAREAHEQGGKIMIARANSTVKSPLSVLFDSTCSDSWWLSIEREFADLEVWDGLVLGEESMYSRPWDLWPAGWRIFCGESGVDAARIDGDRDQLTGREKQAFLHWEQERVIDSFNWMVDFIKLYFGKQRPGFMVSTFMPQQNGPSLADRRWKFDVGGAYLYGEGNLERYNLIRRYKTLWPDRPVMWLVSGNVGTPATYLTLPLTKYNSPCPKTPLQGRESKGYADAVTAWLAGADPAYFAIWLFTRKGEKGPNAGGVWEPLESISATSATLDQGIENLFVGVEDMYRFAAENGTAEDNATVSIDSQGAEPDIELDEKDMEKDPSRLRVKREKHAVRTGFLLEQKFLYDIARLLNGMPRPAPRHEVLFIGSLNMPLAAVAPDYDFVSLINQMPEFDLGGYRLIGVEGQDKAPLFDSTIRTLTAWVKQQPGVLYVRGWLADDNALEASTPEDLDGKLQNDWPWESDVDYDGKQYRVKGGRAKALGAETPGVVEWKGDGFKGVVVFDSLRADPERVRAVLAGVKARHGVGVDFAAPSAVQYMEKGGVTAASRAVRAGALLPLKGVELLTGEADPVVWTNRSAAIVASEYRGPYAACLNGVAVLCERPIRSIEAVPGGLKLTCDGLVKAGSVTGKVDVDAEGDAPAEVTGEEPILQWLVYKTDPGIARVLIPGTRNEVVFIRHSNTITIRSAKLKREVKI